MEAFKVFCITEIVIALIGAVGFVIIIISYNKRR